MNSPRHWIILGAILASISVVLGAFGAHGLESTLAAKYANETRDIAGFTVPASYKYVQDWITASRYQMYHALGLILLGILSTNPATRSQKIAAWSFVLGILFFCGSLYVLVLTGMPWLGAIAPIGGTLMIVAWIAFAFGAARSREFTAGAN